MAVWVNWLFQVDGGVETNVLLFSQLIESKTDFSSGRFRWLNILSYWFIDKVFFFADLFLQVLIELDW